MSHWTRNLLPLALLLSAWAPVGAAETEASETSHVPAVSLPAGCCASPRQPIGRCCWCPDDYDPKPLPCFHLPPICGTCDDYCPKPLPRFCLPPLRGVCDDYCRKPSPLVALRFGFAGWYRCPPPRGDGRP